MTLKIRPVIEAQILLRYSAIRSDALSGVPITVLHIGPEQTVIATGADDEAGAIIALEIGSQKTSADHFKHIMIFVRNDAGKGAGRESGAALGLDVWRV